jgi:hypothetical protein
MRRRGAQPPHGALLQLSALLLLLLLLAPAAVQGFFAGRRTLPQPTARRHHHQHQQHRRTTADARISIRNPATAADPATTRLASSRASSDGFGDARGRSAFLDQGRIELLCKAGRDGASLGDCPFCHYVQMVLRYKVGACVLWRPSMGG